MDAAVVASCISAAASLGALATGIYAVQYTARQAERTERSRSARERLTPEIQSTMKDLQALQRVLLSADESSDQVLKARLEEHLEDLCNTAPEQTASAAFALLLSVDTVDFVLRMTADLPVEQKAEKRAAAHSDVKARTDRFATAYRRELGL